MFLRKMIGRHYRPFRKKRVVMFHAGRSGSTVLGLMLHDHPKVFWAGELMQSKWIAKYKKRNLNFDYKEILRSDENRALSMCYGFEMKYMHMRHLHIPKAQFLKDVVDLGYTHFVILTRLNFLRKRTSGVVAETTGSYHLRESKSSKLVRVPLKAETLIPLFDQYKEDISEIQRLLRDKPFINLTYEHDVQNDPSVGYKKICELLGLPARLVRAKLQRVNPYPLSEIIINFDEVVSTLKGTEYEWMLEQS